VNLFVGKLFLNVEVSAVIDECDVITMTTLDVLINGVVTYVNLAIWEPAIQRCIALIQNLCILLVPVDLFMLSKFVEVRGILFFNK
jgi:hypothetical protein